MTKEFKHTMRLDDAHEKMLADICAFENKNITEVFTMLIEHWTEEIRAYRTECPEVLVSKDAIVASIQGLVDVVLPGED